MAKIKPKKVSKTELKTSWFHKWNHKSVFEYNIKQLVIKMDWYPKYFYMNVKNHLRYLFEEYFSIITTKNPIEKFSIGFLSTPLLIIFSNTTY